MRKSSWLLSAAAFTLAFPAYAQDTTGQDDTPAEDPTSAANVDEGDQDAESDDDAPIVITAQGRSQALSDVPLAVSAVTAETLENSGASDIRQLTQVSPSLLVSSTSSEAAGGVARIRGIGTVGDNAGLESSVAVFIDGVYRSRTGTGLTELGPLDRIEVLRGPQGTLFGRNASAGLVHVITAKPRFRTEVYGSATIGNYDLRRFELGVTGPLSDTVAARIDGIYLERDGFVEDVISGQELNDRNRWLLRGQLLFEPDDNFSLRIIGDYSKRDENCCAASYLPTRDYTAPGMEGPSSVRAILEGLGAVINDDTFDRETSVTPGRSYNSDVVDWGISAEATYDFGGVELTSITAYRYNDYERGQDADYNNLDILYRDGSGGATTTFKTFTQELRLQGQAFNDRLDWLIGGFFMSERLELTDNLAFGNDYSAYANCLVANNFAASPLVPTAIIQTSNPTCFNPAVSAGVRAALEGQFIAAAGNPAAQAAIQEQLLALSAFARLNPGAVIPVDFSGMPFTNSGFTNIGLANMVPGLTLTGVALDDRFVQRDTNFSIFTHNIISITDRLKLTLGARYTWDRKKLDFDLVDNNTACAFYSAAAPGLQTLPCVIPAAPGGSFSGDDVKKESQLSGTAVLSWKPVDSVLLYASYSRGYKAGGFNLDRSALPRSNGNGAILPGARGRDLRFDPEINDAYEIGLKYNGRGIDVNFAVFQQDFKDFQLNTFNGLFFEVETINSCEDLDVADGDTDNSALTGNCAENARGGVRTRGFELELFTRPIPNVSFNAGVTYADTKYRSNLVGATGEAISPSLFQLSGRNISNAPKWVLTGSLAWTPPIGNSGLRGLIYVDARSSSSFNTGSDLDVEKIQDSYVVFNARVGLRGANDTWSLELWGQNIFNEKYQQVGFDTPIQGSCTERGANAGFCSPVPNLATQLYSSFLAEPRTFGLTLRAKWKPEPRYVEEEEYVAPPPPPPAPPPATQTCSDGSVILATETCPPPPPPPPPPPEPERG